MVPQPPPRSYPGPAGYPVTPAKLLSRLGPSSWSVIWVPPIDVTSGSDDGHELTGNGYSAEPSAMKSVAPASPEDARTVTPCRAASLNAYRRFSRLEKSPWSNPGNVFSVA